MRGMAPMLDAGFWIVGKEMGTGLQPSAFAKATADKATEATGPLFRPFFSLPKNHVNKMLRACDPRDCARGEAITRPLLNDALEHDSRVRGFRRRRSEGAPSIGRSVQNLLATYFRVHLPPRLLRRGRAGPDPGFSSHGS